MEVRRKSTSFVCEQRNEKKSKKIPSAKVLLCWCQIEKEKNESKRREPMKQALTGFWSVVTFLEKKKFYWWSDFTEKEEELYNKSTGRTQKKKKREMGNRKKVMLAEPAGSALFDM